jgi:hypothetical protein
MAGIRRARKVRPPPPADDKLTVEPLYTICSSFAICSHRIQPNAWEEASMSLNMNFSARPCDRAPGREFCADPRAGLFQPYASLVTHGAALKLRAAGLRPPAVHRGWNTVASSRRSALAMIAWDAAIRSRLLATRSPIEVMASAISRRCFANVARSELGALNRQTEESLGK